MRSEAPIVPLCSSLEAFEVFSQHVEKGLSDFAGQPIEIDYGNYTHVMKDESRLQRAPWIASTVFEPDEVWLVQPRDMRKRWRGIQRQVYLKWLKASEEDEEELFAVVVERMSFGGLRLRTWHRVEDPHQYVGTLRRQGGEKIWPEKS